MKKTLLTAMFFALPAAAQSAASVCGTVLMSDDKIRCMQAIAGHNVEAGAAAVCNTVLMGNDKTECLRGTLDKHYQPDELSACRSVLMGDEKARCMAAAGAYAQAPQRRDDYREERRDDRRDDRDRDDRRSRRSRDDDDDEDDTRVLRLTNYHRAAVDRLYYRSVDARRFHEVRLPEVAYTNRWVEVRVPNEKVEMCAETPDGYYLHFPKVRRSEAIVIGTDENHWHQGRCRDVR